MCSDLINLVTDAKDGDVNSLYILLIKFNPLLIKYSRCLKYEDAKSDLTLCFIEIINKMSLKEEFLNDKFLLGYIKKAIINSYLNIKKYNDVINFKEQVYEINDYDNKIDFQSDLEFHDLLKCLSKKEKIVITLKYLNCLSDVQIAKKLNLSRQYVNKLNRQALTKIRNYME